MQHPLERQRFAPPGSRPPTLAPQPFPLAHFHKQTCGLLVCSSARQFVEIGSPAAPLFPAGSVGPPPLAGPGKSPDVCSATANTPPSHPEAGFFIYDSVFPSRDSLLTITAFFKNHSFPVLSPSHSLQTHSLSSHSLKLIHFNQQSTCKVLLSWEPLPGWRTPGRTPTAYVFLFL
jgi:hypothetical protein